MADRILTWYVEAIVSDGTGQGPVYCLEDDYTPVALRLYATIAPDTADLQVDIKDDGTSIFTHLPTLQKGQNGQDWWEDFSTDITMEKYSWISLDVSSGGAKRITVQLELNKVLSDDEPDVEDI